MKEDRGQAIVLVAATLGGAVLLVALALNTGALFVARTSVRQAADAAALAAAIVLTQGGTSAQAAAAARTNATNNGYTAGGAVTVAVNNPPSSGPSAGDARFVEVIVDSRVEPLMPLLGAVTVRGRAVGGPVGTKTSVGVAVLSPTKAAALSASGSSVVQVIGGDIFVNSSDAKAAQVSGSALITAPGQAIAVVGGVGGSGYVPVPTTGAAPRPDPFAGYPTPSTSGLGSPQSCCSITQLTISPGLYTSMKITAPVTMQPGTYILLGNGLEVKSGGSLTGTGVTIFNTTKDYPAATGGCDEVLLEVGTAVLSAPASGTYKGMVVFSDPACPNDVRLKGNVSVLLTGTIYAPKAKVKVSGSADITVTQQIVADQVLVSGSGTYTVSFDANQTARSLSPGLAE